LVGESEKKLNILRTDFFASRRESVSEIEAHKGKCQLKKSDSPFEIRKKHTLKYLNSDEYIAVLRRNFVIFQDINGKFFVILTYSGACGADIDL
jgi:hypothetical protein